MSAAAIGRRYSSFDLLRFAKFKEENQGIKPVDLINKYHETYPPLTPKEQMENLCKALKIDPKTKR